MANPNMVPKLTDIGYRSLYRIQSHITHIQHTSILPTLILTSVVHHPTTSFNPILIHSNTTPPFCHLVTKPLPLPSLHNSFTPNSKHCSLANPILIHRHPHTSLPVSTPNTIHHSRLTVCLSDSLDHDRCLSILFWLSAFE